MKFKKKEDKKRQKWSKKVLVQSVREGFQSVERWAGFLRSCPLWEARFITGRPEQTGDSEEDAH